LNVPSEIEQAGSLYPQVQFIPVDRDASILTGKSLVYLDDVLAALADSSAAVCGIVNSDVELRADDGFPAFIAAHVQDGLVYGSRLDVPLSGDSAGSEYHGGFDFFFFTTDVIRHFPRSGFCLGAPWWDYWMPLVPLLAGLPVQKLNSPIAFHGMHDVRWQPELFEALGRELQRMYAENELPISETDQDWSALFAGGRGLSTTDFCNLLRVTIKQRSRKIYYGVVPMFPKISVVTPSFNQGRFLEKTILSVLNQGYPNLEYIIIDGGSTDNSVEIIKRYEQHLTYWESEPDRGQSHAINKGFARATGDIFAWLNSDDWYEPGALQKVAEVFTANPEAGAVVGAGNMVDEVGNEVLLCEPFEVTVASLYGWVDRFFWQPSCFFTRKAWESSGPLDEGLHFAMDLDLWFKIAASWKFAMTEANLSWSLKHADAKTTSSGADTLVEALQVISRYGGDQVTGQVMRREITERDRQLHQLLAELKEAVGHVHAANSQVADLKKELYQVRSELDSVYASTSCAGPGVSGGWRLRCINGETNDESGCKGGVMQRSYAAECDRVAREFGVRPDIHEEDFIFQFMVEHPNIGLQGKAVEEYFSNGRESARKLQKLLTDVCGYQDKKIDLFEFASGYGCVSRHISQVIPSCTLTACDIHEQATRFLSETLNIDTVLSTTAPENLRLDMDFDVVFALSFFSHMPKSSFARWVRRLASFVRPEGYLIFTTHGMVSRKVCFDDCALDAEGFYFHPSSEQKDLSTNEYGNAVVAPRYVFNLVENESNLALKLFHEGFWWGHQDLYVVRRVTTEQMVAQACLKG
jgi:glycosyltransferase involved in cell wall biosynthesis